MFYHQMVNIIVTCNLNSLTDYHVTVCPTFVYKTLEFVLFEFAPLRKPHSYGLLVKKKQGQKKHTKNNLSRWIGVLNNFFQHQKTGVEHKKEIITHGHPGTVMICSQVTMASMASTRCHMSTWSMHWWPERGLASWLIQLGSWSVQKHLTHGCLF